MKRAKLNYWVDVLMGLAFALSAISGLIFLLPLGFLSAGAGSALGVSYRLWDRVHTWSSLALIASVGAHLLLHTKWIAAMTKKILGPSRVPKTTSTGRRRALRWGGAAIGVGALAALGGLLRGRGVTAGAEEAEGAASATISMVGRAKAEVAHPKPDVDTDKAAAPAAVEAAPETPTPTPVAAPSTPTPEAPAPVPEDEGELCVACPHGLVNDPYPGRCRRYRDRDGDGICDLSVPQPCG